VLGCALILRTKKELSGEPTLPPDRSENYSQVSVGLATHEYNLIVNDLALVTRFFGVDKTTGQRRYSASRFAAIIPFFRRALVQLPFVTIL
jgi:hypothetical protein